MTPSGRRCNSYYVHHRHLTPSNNFGIKLKNCNTQATHLPHQQTRQSPGPQVNILGNPRTNLPKARHTSTGPPPHARSLRPSCAGRWPPPTPRLGLRSLTRKFSIAMRTIEPSTKARTTAVAVAQPVGPNSFLLRDFRRGILQESSLGGRGFFFFLSGRFPARCRHPGGLSSWLWLPVPTTYSPSAPPSHSRARIARPF